MKRMSRRTAARRWSTNSSRQRKIAQQVEQVGAGRQHDDAAFVEMGQRVAHPAARSPGCRMVRTWAALMAFLVCGKPSQTRALKKIITQLSGAFRLRRAPRSGTHRPCRHPAAVQSGCAGRWQHGGDALGQRDERRHRAGATGPASAAAGSKRNGLVGEPVLTAIGLVAAPFLTKVSSPF